MELLALGKLRLENYDAGVYTPVPKSAVESLSTEELLSILGFASVKDFARAAGRCGYTPRMDADARDNLIPADEPENVQRLVAREVNNLLELHTARIDLEYRVRRWKELAARHRALRSEVAEVKRQMEALSPPPLLLRELKSGLGDGG